MNYYKVLDLARQFGLDPSDGSLSKANLQRFAKAVAQYERKACAKICDKLQDDIATEPKHCAESIRARYKARRRNGG